jgi:hypothetical protein
MGYSLREGPLPVVQYWHSPEVPADVAELIATFREFNPTRHLLFHRTEAEEFIAEHLGERELGAFRSCAVPAMQADYFRYCAVLALGGICADADLRCLRPLDALIPTVDRGVLFENPRNITVNGFLAFRSRGHPLMRIVLEAATENIERRVSNGVAKVTGPWVLTGLRTILESGSLDEARRRFAGGDDAKLAESLADSVGTYERLALAFEGVRIEPLESAFNWIAKPTAKPRYKRNGSQWMRWGEQRTIFR